MSSYSIFFSLYPFRKEHQVSFTIHLPSAIYTHTSQQMSLARDTDSQSTELVSLVNSDLSPNTSHGLNIHTRTGENMTKIWLWAIAPLILHLSTALVLVGFLAFRIDKHDSNLHSRNASTHFTPLQSDITTAVSAGVTIARFFVAMWSAATIWRFIFILMEKDVISLQQIDTLLTWQIHFLPRLNSSRKVGLLISIVLYLSLPCQLSGPILTGSITWSSSNSFIDGGNLTNISAAGPITDSFKFIVVELLSGVRINCKWLRNQCLARVAGESRDHETGRWIRLFDSQFHRTTSPCMPSR